ncbi:MAG: class I SAM-dependent methyltransferase [Anaerolineales bacterium]|nr:class I SAM-dependent methyltransferase [Anaerolineales bacterium]
MELSTVQRLAELNRQFYVEQAENFADSRPRLAPGVERVLAQITADQSLQALSRRRVLEVGCGDGKAGRALARAGVGVYVGVDSSPALLERARRYCQQLEPANSAAINFILGDLLDADWTRGLPPEPSDWILAFSVFHHLPSQAARSAVLCALAGRLASGGTLAMSNWQFTRSARLGERIRGWPALGLTEADVEPGDYVLDWERKGTRGLRYVHLLDEAEARALAEAAGLRVVAVFRADGLSGDLADYVLMQPPAAGQRPGPHDRSAAAASPRPELATARDTRASGQVEERPDSR